MHNVILLIYELEPLNERPLFYAGNTVTTTFYFDVYFRTRLHVSTARSHFQAILGIKRKR
jgi:hypothetical protein